MSNNLFRNETVIKIEWFPTSLYIFLNFLCFNSVKPKIKHLSCRRGSWRWSCNVSERPWRDVWLMANRWGAGEQDAFAHSRPQPSIQIGAAGAPAPGHLHGSQLTDHLIRIIPSQTQLTGNGNKCAGPSYRWSAMSCLHKVRKCTLTLRR